MRETAACADVQDGDKKVEVTSQLSGVWNKG